MSAPDEVFASECTKLKLNAGQCLRNYLAEKVEKYEYLKKLYRIYTDIESEEGIPSALVFNTARLNAAQNWITRVNTNYNLDDKRKSGFLNEVNSDIRVLLRERTRLEERETRSPENMAALNIELEQTLAENRYYPKTAIGDKQNVLMLIRIVKEDIDEKRTVPFLRALQRRLGEPEDE